MGAASSLSVAGAPREPVEDRGASVRQGEERSVQCLTL